MKKGIKKKQMVNQIVTAVSIYNGICFVFCMYGKIVGSYPIMDASVISVSIPIVLYFAYKCVAYTIRFVMVLQLLASDMRRPTRTSETRKYSKAA